MKAGRTIGCVSLVAVILVSLYLVFDGNAVELSRETTYLVEPVGPDGAPDYLRAVNEELGKDVKPDENAAVPLQAVLLAPQDVPTDTKRQFAELLGTEFSNSGKPYPSIPPGGNFDAVTACSWTKTDHPDVHRMLLSCGRSLDTFVEACRRTSYFEPLVEYEDPKYGRIYASLDADDLVYALVARATLRCGEDQTGAAWQDLFACHRFIALRRTAGTFLGPVTSTSAHALLDASEVLVGLETLSPEQLKSMMADMKALPQGSSFNRRVDFVCRCITLRGALVDDRYALGTRDRQEILQLLNRFFDDVAVALKRPTCHERIGAVDMIEKSYFYRFIDSEESLPRGPREVFARHRPTVLRYWEYLDGCCQTIQSLVTVALALEVYSRERGAYPDDLSALSPRHLSEVPKDVFDGKELKYRKGGQGYLLYSVGRNGIADRGASDGGETSDEDDDIIFRKSSKKTEREQSQAE